MSQDKVTISFSCKKCGTKVTWPDDAVDATKIACSNCGEDFGTYGDLHHTAMEATKAHVRGLAKDAFKGFQVKFD